MRIQPYTYFVQLCKFVRIDPKALKETNEQRMTGFNAQINGGRVSLEVRTGKGKDTPFVAIWRHEINMCLRWRGAIDGHRNADRNTKG